MVAMGNPHPVTRALTQHTAVNGTCVASSNLGLATREGGCVANNESMARPTRREGWGVVSGNKSAEDAGSGSLRIGPPVVLSGPPNTQILPPNGGSGVGETTVHHHRHESSDAVTVATLREVTEQMSQALAEFDDLLGMAQTSL